MKLKCIFVDESSYQGIHSVCFGSIKSEYEKVFDKWNDIRYIRKFCLKNLHHLQSGFYGNISLEDAINSIRQEVYDISKTILLTNNFDHLFQPLNDNEFSQKDHSFSKVKRSKKAKLRLYAIRLCQNTFVITGGAIKVVHKMKDHEDTMIEKKKLDKVRDWLKEQEIYINDDLIYYYEQEQEQ